MTGERSASCSPAPTDTSRRLRALIEGRAELTAVADLRFFCS